MVKNNDILNELYMAREEGLYQKAEEELGLLKERIKRNKKHNEELEEIMKKVPEEYMEIFIEVKELLERKLEREYEMEGDYNEKFYRMGFEDAVRLIYSSM